MDALPHMQDLYAEILSGISDGVAVADAAGTVMIWNRAAEEITGIASPDALGKPVSRAFPGNPAVVELIEKSLATGRSYSDYEAELLIRHGMPRPVSILTNILTDDNGNAHGVIISIRDQAGVRDMKERMRRSDRLAALGLIAAGIAHEIKNPLVGIRGAAQLMRSEIRPQEAGSLTEYLDVILKEADRLNNVLEGILDFTRIKSQDIRAVNIHTIIDRALLLNESSARKSGVVLVRLYDPSLPDVVGNGDQLLQVFLNIIKNAIEAMPGGGKLTVLTRMSDQYTSVQADGKKHRLMVAKVTDTGPGIGPEQQKQIFTPFFTTKDRGTGLGLALSYQIVQEHLGTIRVESNGRDGTTFGVYLPLSP